jgi:hypothetical protein
MKKLIPVMIIFGLLLSGCGLLQQFQQPDDQLSEAEMATRVAELLATMTTPTLEEVFPPTPTAGLPTVNLPTVETPVVVITEAPTEPPATEEPTEEPTVEVTETPTATPEPTEDLPDTDPAKKLGAPTGSDPMDNAGKWFWPTDTDQYLKVEFKNGYMDMTGLTSYAGWRLPALDQQTNHYIELTVNSGECKEKDSYGIIFRVPVFKEPDQGYLFEVTCDGYLRLWEWDGTTEPKGTANVLINWQKSADLKTGTNKTNRLGVMAKGKTIGLYINGVPQGEATDNSYKAGFFGVFVHTVTSEKYTVKFDEMKYWEIK